MGGSMRNLRPHPLLEEPPAESGKWWVAGGDDKARLEEGLRSIQKSGFLDREVAWMHYLMRGLGYETSIGRVDEAAMQQERFHPNQPPAGLTGALMPYFMKWLDLVDDIGYEEGMMREEAKMYPKHGEYDAAAWIHKARKDLGFPDTMTDADRAGLSRHLGKSRDRGDGFGVAEAAYLMRELGVNGGLADGDEELMRAELKGLREGGERIKLARMLFYLQGLFKKSGGDREPLSLPPLRKFAKAA